MAQNAVDECCFGVPCIRNQHLSTEKNISEALCQKKNVREITYIRYKYPTFLQSSDLV
jgi:hypothetical protein